MPQPAIIDLSTFDLLKVEGADAVRFLQGQATCDFQRLSSQGVLPGAFCNTKGRIISAFHAVGVNEHIYLQCPAGLGELVAQHLEKFRVFFKVTISRASDEWARFAFVGEDARQVLAGHYALNLKPATTALIRAADGALVFRQASAPDAPWQLWLPLEQKASLSRTLLHHVHSDLNLWRLATIQAGQHFPTLSQTGQFTPEELNLDWSDAVSFTKGCYTGQEVVARMHYRGQGKKRLHLCRSLAPWPLPLDHSSPIHIEDAEGKPLASLVAEATATDEQLYGLAVMRADTVGGTLNLSADNIKEPCTIQSLQPSGDLAQG